MKDREAPVVAEMAGKPGGGDAGGGEPGGCAGFGGGWSAKTRRPVLRGTLHAVATCMAP